MKTPTPRFLSCLCAILWIVGCGGGEDTTLVQAERDRVHEVLALSAASFEPCLDIARGKARILEPGGPISEEKLRHYENFVVRSEAEFTEQALRLASDLLDEIRQDGTLAHPESWRVGKVLAAHKTLCFTAKAKHVDADVFEQRITDKVEFVYEMRDLLPYELQLTEAQEQKAMEPHREALGTVLVQARRKVTRRSKAEDWRQRPKETQERMTREEYRQAQAEWEAHQQELEHQRTRRAQLRAQYHRVLEEERRRAAQRPEDFPTVGVRPSAPSSAAPPRGPDPRLPAFRAWQKTLDSVVAPITNAVDQYMMVKEDASRSASVCRTLLEAASAALDHEPVFRVPVSDPGLETALRELLGSFQAAGRACGNHDSAAAQEHLQAAGTALARIQRQIESLEARLVR